MNVMGLVVLLLFLVGVVLLHIFLSRRESQIPGLVLPGISLIVSFLFLLNMAVLPGSDGLGLAMQMLSIWLLLNIPTAVLLAIYFACRKGKKRNKPVDRMNIQDLE